MRPFLMRFARSQSNLDAQQLPPMLYDPHLEAVVTAIQGKPRLVIDEPSIGMRTGTYGTASDIDTTSDEPTDRS
jgi:hypothetical protein